MLQILLSFVPFIILCILIKLLKIKFPKVTNLFLLSFLAMILVIGVFNPIIELIVSDNYSLMESARTFSFYLLFAGVAEEVGKFIPIKISKPKSNSEILLNSIFIGCILGCLENYGYMSLDISINLIFIRMSNMHILFQIIMGWLLVFGNCNKKRMFGVLALIIPILGHAIWDFANGSTFSFIIGTIINYGTLIVTLIHIKKMQSKEEQQIEIKKSNSIFKVIILIVCILLWILFYNNSSSRIELGDTCKFNNVEMTVLSSEKVEYENFLGTKEKYLKVKIKVKNNNSEKIELDPTYGFRLVNLVSGEYFTTSIESSVEDDGFFSKLINYYDYIENIDEAYKDANKINANSEVEGYIYFKVAEDIKDYKLTYTTTNNTETSCNLSIY